MIPPIRFAIFGSRARIFVLLRERLCGFTLVETLVGATILIVVVMLLSQILSHVGGIWLAGHALVEKSEGGRAVLEFITKELQAAQLPANRTEQRSLQLLVNPSSVSAAYLNKDAIFWQAPLATNSTYGDLAEIGYFVQWDEKTTPGNPHANLCRFFINPNPSDPNYRIYSSAGGAWVDDATIAAVAPADNSNVTNPYQGLFVENVLALWVICLDPVGNPISGNSFDSRTGYTYTDQTGTSVSMPKCALPAAIDLSFVMLDSNSAKRITPSIEQEIKQLAGQASNAKDFLEAAQKDPMMKPILSAICPRATRIYLKNSK